jgi:homoserine kinase
VLPDTLSRTDAVFNLGRMGLLLAGLADPSVLVPQATDDRIHQPARTALFPEAPALLRALVEAGARAASWSGAGPPLLGIVPAERADAVRAGGEAALAAQGVTGRVLVLSADRRGIVYGDEAEVAL